MLYYCGYTKTMGDVDSGSTITDYMEQERERGKAAEFVWGLAGWSIGLMHVCFAACIHF